MRLFGYFLHEQKVTRVWAGEAQDLRGTGAEPPKTRHGPEGPKIISKKLLTNNNFFGMLTAEIIVKQ